jgi:moderate conductance mechanosensitive channel
MTRETLSTILLIVAVFAVAAIIARLGHSIVERALGAMEIGSAENRAALRLRARRFTHALTLLAFLAAGLVAISLALAWFGVDEQNLTLDEVRHWILTSGRRIVLIVVGALVVVRAAHLALEQLQHRLTLRRAPTDLEWQRRASTLASLLGHLISVTVGFVAVLMLLKELTLDVMPILTGAGIAGLAVGFGAQNLVRDVISGFFLILEDQVRIGDLARINNVTGKVEQINLRTIVLRDGDGAVQVFPNGTITALANLSKQYAYAVVDVRVAYSENFDRVYGTIREVASAMQRDQAWAAQILAPLDILGVESLDNGMATVRVRFKALPLQQGAVGNELRRRLMSGFVGRGIKPYAG